jgi:hypothetical protein
MIPNKPFLWFDPTGEILHIRIQCGPGQGAVQGTPEPEGASLVLPFALEGGSGDVQEFEQ